MSIPGEPATVAVVGNGIIVTYASLSGSTFVNCLASVANVTIPTGSPIQQAGNTAAYQAAAVIGQNATGLLRPDYNLTGTTFATSTVTLNALPAYYPVQLNTVIPAAGSASPTYGNIAPNFFAIRIHASPGGNPTFTTQQIVGSVTYYMAGNKP